LAIDPGNEESALLVYDTDTGLPEKWAKLPNDQGARLWMDFAECDSLAIEMVASYGMAVGASVFETCVWAGRFIERWILRSKGSWQPLYRREIKLHICGSARAKDANIRQALIDRYGGKQQAVGLKKTPGPLYGMSVDCWSALAVAVTVADRTP
jgi:hypothetical protein